MVLWEQSFTAHKPVADGTLVHSHCKECSIVLLHSVIFIESVHTAYSNQSTVKLQYYCDHTFCSYNSVTANPQYKPGLKYKLGSKVSH